MIGKKIIITGMELEVLSDEGEKWKLRNITSDETVFIDKSVLDQSIKFGKAEEIEVCPKQGPPGES